MMKKNVLFFVVTLFLVFSPLNKTYAQDNALNNSQKKEDFEPVPYSDDEFPQWSKDLRRTEIIAFGSLPFVTLGVTTGYSIYKYASGETEKFPNPLDKENGFSTEEIITVVGVSAGISAILGLIDLGISYSKRKKAAELKALQEAEQRQIVNPITPEEAGNMLRKNNDASQIEQMEAEE